MWCLLAPVISAMLAARGFSWKRKLIYASITLGVFALFRLAYEVFGLLEIAARQQAENPDAPSLLVLFYGAFLTSFPLAMLVFFVGRTPSLLWSKRVD